MHHENIKSRRGKGCKRESEREDGSICTPMGGPSASWVPTFWAGGRVIFNYLFLLFLFPSIK